MRYYSDTAPTTTIQNSGGINNVQTSLVLSASLSSYLSSFPFVLRLEPGSSNEELVLVNSGSGTAGDPYVITRGWGTTTAKTHAQSSTVQHGVGSPDFSDSRAHEALTTTAHGGVFAQAPAAAEKIIFVSSRGNDSNDGLTTKTAKLTLAAAVTALGGSGKILVGAGSTSVSSRVDMTSLNGITIEGVSSATTAGAAACSIISFTGTGSGAALDFGHSQGVTIKNLMILYSSASYTGDLVNFSAASGSAASYIRIEDCYIGASGGVQTANSLINLTLSQNVLVQNCHLADSVYGVYGQSATQQANVVKITRVTFRRQTGYSIYNPGYMWALEHCTFEGGSACNAVSHAGGVRSQGLVIKDCWSGDTGGGTQYDIDGDGFSVTGNWIGATAGTGVNITNNCVGFVVRGNYFIGCTSGIVLGGTGCKDYDCRSNYYNTVTTNISGGPSAKLTPATDSATAMVWTNASGATILTFNSANGRFGTNAVAPNAHFHSGGGMSIAYVNKTGAYTATANDHAITCDAGGGAFTLTLPTAVAVPGRCFTVKRTNSGANAVTVGTTSSQTIDGATTYSLSAQYKYVSVVSDGANWQIVANN